LKVVTDRKINLPVHLVFISTLVCINILKVAAIFCDEDSIRHFPWRAAYNCSQHENDVFRKDAFDAIVNVYIIHNNKPTAIIELVRSLFEIGNCNVIVIDTGSTLVRSFRILKSLSKYPNIQIISLRPTVSSIINNNDRFSINKLFKEVSLCIQSHRGSSTAPYIVTDPDLSLYGMPPDVLGVMQHILKSMSYVDVVGLGLRLDDLPHDCIFCRSWHGDESVFRWESQYWPNFLRGIAHPKGKATVYYAKGARQWHALMPRSIRLIHPYACRHVDWYYKSRLSLPSDVMSYACQSKLTHGKILNCSGSAKNAIWPAKVNKNAYVP